MMKKIYLHPEMLVVRIETTGMLALSKKEEEVGAGGAFASHRDINFEDDEEDDEEF